LFRILSRLLCKYCDKQITPTDRVSGRNFMSAVSVMVNEKQVCRGFGDLQIALIDRFCNFFKNKTVHCNMQAITGQTVIGLVFNQVINGYEISCY